MCLKMCHDFIENNEVEILNTWKDIEPKENAQRKSQGLLMEPLQSTGVLNPENKKKNKVDRTFWQKPANS